MAQLSSGSIFRAFYLELLNLGMIFLKEARSDPFKKIIPETSNAFIQILNLPH